MQTACPIRVERWKRPCRDRKCPAQVPQSPSVHSPVSQKIRLPFLCATFMACKWHCNMITKSPETDIEVQRAAQKSKTARQSCFYLCLSPKWRFCLQESQNETVSESCLSYSIFISRLKGMCHYPPGFYGKLVGILGLKVLHHHCLVCKV